MLAEGGGGRGDVGVEENTGCIGAEKEKLPDVPRVRRKRHKVTTRRSGATSVVKGGGDVITSHPTPDTGKVYLRKLRFKRNYHLTAVFTCKKRVLPLVISKLVPL